MRDCNTLRRLQRESQGDDRARRPCQGGHRRRDDQDGGGQRDFQADRCHQRPSPARASPARIRGVSRQRLSAASPSRQTTRRTFKSAKTTIVGLPQFAQVAEEQEEQAGPRRQQTRRRRTPLSHRIETRWRRLPRHRRSASSAAARARQARTTRPADVPQSPGLAARIPAARARDLPRRRDVAAAAAPIIAGSARERNTGDP